MTVVVGACARCDSPLEQGDLRCAICGQATPAPAAVPTSADDDDGGTAEVLRALVLRCEGCGASVGYDPARGAPACGFCGSVTRVEEVLDPVEQTEAWVPFRVSRQEAAAALKAWLGSRGFFRPGDLSATATLEKLQPLYWVAWVFDARCEVTWAADSDAGARRSAWAPHAGQTRLVFDDVLVSASRGLSDGEVADVVAGYRVDTTSAEPAAEGDCVDLTTVHREAFEVQRSAARRRIVAGVEGAAARRVERDHVPGTRFRNVHTSVLLEGLDTRRLALPAWVLAYRYDGKLYRAVVNGQDAGHVTGTAPWSVARILGVVLAVAAAMIFVGLALLSG